MSEKLNLFCKNCELSWDDIEIKKCPNCNKDDITVVQSIGNNHRKSKIYLILPLLIFVVSALFISNDYVDIIKINLIDFVFQKDDVLIKDNETPRDEWMTNYYDNGQVKQEGESWKGRKDGLWTTYYMNGEIETLGFWKNDEKDGLWKYFQENGLLKHDEQWKNGNLISLSGREVSVDNNIEVNEEDDEFFKEEESISGRDGGDAGEESIDNITSDNASAKERPSKTTIRIKSLAYLPKRARVSPDGKYLYFNVGINPFKGYIFDLKKKELVGVFQDKGYGLLNGKAFYGKEDNALYFECVRNIGTVNYKVFLEKASGLKLGRFNKSGFVNYYKSKGSQEVASQELGKVSLNGSTFENAVRLNNKSVVQIKLDRVVIIQ